jgi:hypothetical protein
VAGEHGPSGDGPPGGYAPTPGQAPDQTAQYQLPPTEPGPPAGGHAPPGPPGPPSGYAPAGSYAPPGNYPPPGGYPPAGGYPPQGGYAAPPSAYPAAPAKSNNGCLKALLISLVILIVLVIGGVGVFVWGASRLVQNTFGTARPGDFELSSSDMTCEVSSTGSMTASGTITNKTDHSQAFRISIDFLEGSAGAKLGDATALSGSLSSGQSSTFRGSDFVTRQPRALTCKITDVSYAGS